MSEEQLKTFLEKVKADTSLQEKLKGAADPEAVVAIAKEAGFAITAEDIQSMQSATELSDVELEGAVGGGGYASEARGGVCPCTAPGNAGSFTVPEGSHSLACP